MQVANEPSFRIISKRMLIEPISNIRKRTCQKHRTAASFSFIWHLPFTIFVAQTHIFDFKHRYLVVACVKIPKQSQCSLVTEILLVLDDSKKLISIPYIGLRIRTEAFRILFLYLYKLWCIPL